MIARLSAAIAVTLDSIDSLKLLRNDAGLSVSQTGNCLLIGFEVKLAG